MKRCVALALVTSLLVGTGAAAAEEAYAIKRKEPAAGDSVQVERTDTLKVVTLLVAKGTKLINETDTAVETSAYKETVLERDGAKGPTKLERAYTKAQFTAGGSTTDLPYHNKTVVIEKKGDRYTFTYKGKGAKELQPGESQLLEMEFNRTPAERGELGKPPAPPGAVKVGEEWKLDPTVLLEPLEKGDAGFDAAKAAGTGQLVKVYKKDDKTFGELRYTVKVPLTSFGWGKQKMSVKDGSASFEVTQDVCIDGTADVGVVRSKAELTAKGTMPTPQGDGDFTVTMLREVRETRKK